MIYGSSLIMSGHLEHQCTPDVLYNPGSLSQSSVGRDINAVPDGSAALLPHTLIERGPVNIARLLPTEML